MPRLLVLTDRIRAEAVGRSLAATVAAAVTAGAPAVVLRERDLPRTDRQQLAIELRFITAETGAWLVIAGDPLLADEVGADGVHLAVRDPVTPAPGLVTGRSCHDATEVADSVAAGLDLVTISPVAVSSSKPGYGPELGTDGFATLAAAAAPLATYALGGVRPDDVGRWLAAGANGVAVMAAVMGADDPAASVRRCLTHLGENAR